MHFILLLSFLLPQTYSKEEVYNAIWQVETGKNLNPPAGDNGKSIGPFQIQMSYWKDSTDFSKCGGKYADCKKLEYSKKVIDGYMKRYCKKYWSDKMSIQDAEEVARSHNGHFVKRKYTDKYWNKVKAVLEKKGAAK